VTVRTNPVPVRGGAKPLSSKAEMTGKAQRHLAHGHGKGWANHLVNGIASSCMVQVHNGCLRLSQIR
jgi:hypothetical protein